MIVVTGGAGFIGSNIIKKLNAAGRNNILVVDDLTDGIKFKNLVDCKIADYIDKDTFLNKFTNKNKIEVIFHQGACSYTTEWNGKFMMENNYEYSKLLLHYCIKNGIPYIYASSAAVYGISKSFTENQQNEKPLNIYGYSKSLFDQYVRNILRTAKSQIIGLRYFNVYGPNESHKGEGASVVFHLNNQMVKDSKVKLFSGAYGYEDGEQKRDFIYVEDVVDVNIWCWQNNCMNGIYNVGTGKAHTFNEIAKEILKWHGKGKISYITFPEHLKNRYQSFTQADITSLRKAGYDKPFKTIKEGVKMYLDFLNKS